MTLKLQRFVSYLVPFLLVIYFTTLFLNGKTLINISLNLPEGVGIKKVYFNEIFMLILIALMLSIQLTDGFPRFWEIGFLKKNKISLTIAGLIAFSLLRLLIDKPGSIEEAGKNIVVSYYLIFALVIVNMDRKTIKAIQLIFIVYFFYEICRIIGVRMLNIYQLYKYATNHLDAVLGLSHLGYAYLVYYLFITKNTKLDRINRFFIFIAISLLLSSIFIGKTTRLIILGIALGYLYSVYLHRENIKRVFWVTGMLLFLIAIQSIWLQPNLFYRDQLSPFNKQEPIEQKESIIKIEPTTSAIENMSANRKIRTEMWKDAFWLFLDHPFWGVGTEKQTVYRIFLCNEGPGKCIKHGEDITHVWNTKEHIKKFYDNSVYPHDAPPISSPHNDFLNMLARFGIFYFLIFIFLTLLSLKALHKHSKMLFLIFIGNLLFCCFQVGMSSPFYAPWSFLLLGSGLWYHINQSRPIVDYGIVE